MVVPFAALAGLKIELQRHRILHGRDGGFDRRVGEHRPTKICVQDRAGQVEQRTRAGPVLPSRRARLSMARRSAVGTVGSPSCSAARATSIVARTALVEAFWP